MRQVILLATLLAAVGVGRVAASPAAARPDDTPSGTLASEAWPRDFRQGAEVLTVYQPQLDAWDGVQLEGQAAVSLRADEGEPIFGVMWFTARTHVNKPARLMTLENLTVTRTSFPSAPDRAEAYTSRLRARVASAPKLIALDRLEADLAISLAGRKGDAVPVRNDPPLIVFFSAPALLVHVDGPPVYQPVERTSLERVVNTRPLLLRDAAGRHFLHLFEGWLEAPGLQGPWVVAKSTSRDLETARSQALATGGVDLLEGSDPAPAQAPKPSLAKGPVPATPGDDAHRADRDRGRAQLGTDRQRNAATVRDTSGHVFKHLGDQETYVLVSGRWFRARSTRGPWEFVSLDGLPADFAAIPDDSPKENVKASVAGTPQAEEALIANRIPQTARVNIKRARLTPPKYDGQPQVRAIEGTSSPVHYVTYVRVYNTYTPWTGWVYGFGFGWSAYAPYPYYVPPYWGAAAAVGPYGAAAWGPGGWAATTGNVYSSWGSTTAVSRASGGYDAWTGNAWASRAGTSYNSRTGVASAGQRAGVQNAYTGNYAAAERGVVQGPGGATAAGARVTAGNAGTGQSVTAGRGAAYNPNTGNAASVAGVRGPEGGVGRVGDEVYAGKDGNVYRHGSDGWQQYRDGGWQPVQDPERARSLEARRSARGTGEGRVQNFRQANPGGSGRTRPSPGARPSRR